MIIEGRSVRLPAKFGLDETAIGEQCLRFGSRVDTPRRYGDQYPSSAKKLVPVLPGHLDAGPGDRC
jgi:hypothetical protein